MLENAEEAIKKDNPEKLARRSNTKHEHDIICARHYHTNNVSKVYIQDVYDISNDAGEFI